MTTENQAPEGAQAGWPSGIDIADEIDALLPTSMGYSTRAAVEQWWRDLVARKLSKLASPSPAEGDEALLKAIADRLHAPGYLARDVAEKHAVGVLETIKGFQPQPKGTTLDPNKIQLCSLGQHSASAQAMGQPCNCPEGTCRLWNGGLRSPDAVPSPAPEQPADLRFSWMDFQQIGEVPAVDEAIRNLLDDQTEDNGVCMIRAICEAAADRLVALAATQAPAVGAQMDELAAFMKMLTRPGRALGHADERGEPRFYTDHGEIAREYWLAAIEWARVTHEHLRSELKTRQQRQHDAETLAGEYLMQRDDARAALAFKPPVHHTGDA